MNVTNFWVKTVFCIGLGVLIAKDNVKAQVSDSTLVVDTTESSYMSIDFSYTNNNIGNSNLASTTIAALFTDISFYHKSGFYAGIMPANYFNASEPSHDLDLAVGYDKYFKNGFSIGTHYTNHQYKGDSTLIGINYKHGLSLSMSYTTNNVYLFADGSSTFGISDNYFLDAGIGYFASFDEVFTPNDNLIFFPMLSFSLGTDHWIYDDMTLADINDTRMLLRSSGYSWDVFDFQMVTFSVPLTYYLGNFSTTITYLYSIPSAKYEVLSWEKQSAFMLSLGYMLNF